MMRLLRAVVLSAALLCVGSSLGAQVPVQLTGAGNTSYAGYMVGPYTGSLPGFPSLDFYCVDFLNGVHVGDQWNARLTSLGNFVAGQTRYGQFYGLSGLARYQQAAWLSTQFSAFSGLGSAERSLAYGTLHTAIWHVMTSGLPNPYTGLPNWSPSYNGVSAADWVTAAQKADMSGMRWNYWQVVTDMNTNSLTTGKQEYLTYVTPEPATIFLMGTGLVAVLGMTFITRRSLG